MKNLLMMEAVVDDRRSDLRKSCLSVNGDCKYDDNVNRLKIMVENQIQCLKMDLQQLKGSEMVSREDLGQCNIPHGAKTIENFLEVDQKVDVLKDILAVGFKQISAAIFSKENMLSELQWEHELQGEISSIVLQDSVKRLQDEYETMLYHQTLYIKYLNKNWKKKASEFSALRDELHALSDEVSNHENFEDWSIAKRKEHFPLKVLENHNFPSQSAENGTMMVGTSADSGEHMLDIADLPQLKHMSKEELLAYCKTEMANMRRRHDSALQEKTEELFRLKREFLKEKGSSTFRKDKECEHLRKKLPEFIIKLDEILVVRDMFHPIYKYDDEMQSFKLRIDSLFSENKHLQNLLIRKTNELKFLSAQFSDAVSQISLNSSLEAKYLRQVKKLESDIEVGRAEANFRDAICNTILRGLIDDHRHAMLDTEIEVKFFIKIYSTMFRGVIYDAISSMNPAILKCYEEKISLEALVVEKEKALTSEIEENQKLKKVIASIFSSIEEKEKLASEVASTLIQQKQQLDVAHQELNTLRDQISIQEAQISDNKMESNLLRSRFNGTLQKIYHYELEMDKLQEKLKVASDALREAEKQKLMLLGVIEDRQRTLSSSFDKDKEQVKQLKSITVSMMELSKCFTDLGSQLMESTNRNESRLKVLSHQLNSLVQLASQKKKKCFWYKNMLDVRCSDLQKAEAEVDLLGDEVEALVGLLGKIYLALDHYSPVLQHYPGVVEILKLVQRELIGENDHNFL